MPSICNYYFNGSLVEKKIYIPQLIVSPVSLHIYAEIPYEKIDILDEKTLETKTFKLI